MGHAAISRALRGREADREPAVSSGSPAYAVAEASVTSLLILVLRTSAMLTASNQIRQYVRCQHRSPAGGGCRRRSRAQAVAIIDRNRARRLSVLCAAPLSGAVGAAIRLIVGWPQVDRSAR